MTNETILKKAIEKAKKNGYRFLNIIYDGKDTLENCSEENLYYQFIFSHGFAKAFWGEEDKWWGLKNWQYHLQIMVLEKEPLLYLKKFL